MKSIKSTPLLSNFLWMYFMFVLISSCSSDDETEDNVVADDLSDAHQQVQIDMINENINDIIENAYYEAENQNAQKKTAAKTNQKTSFLPECVNVSWQIHDANNITVTLDYGDGCTTANNHFLEGKIIVDFELKREVNEVIALHQFEDFYFDQNKIEGNEQKTHFVHKDNQNPYTNIERHLKITLKDSSSLMFSETGKRECIDGHGTSTWTDNVYLITGNRTVIHSSGLERHLSVKEALRKDMDCKVLTAGILEVKTGQRMLEINYGDGTCDNIVEVTISGKAYPINF